MRLRSKEVIVPLEDVEEAISDLKRMVPETLKPLLAEYFNELLSKQTNPIDLCEVAAYLLKLDVQKDIVEVFVRKIISRVEDPEKKIVGTLECARKRLLRMGGE